MKSIKSMKIMNFMNFMEFMNFMKIMKTQCKNHEIQNLDHEIMKSKSVKGLPAQQHSTAQHTTGATVALVVVMVVPCGAEHLVGMRVAKLKREWVGW